MDTESRFAIAALRLFSGRAASKTAAPCLRLALVLAATLALEAFGADQVDTKPVTGEQLEQILTAAHGESDVQIAAELSELSLTERLSAARLSRCEAGLSGVRTRQALMALADMSQFLDPPASELPKLPKPELEAQRKIIALTVDYATKTIHQWPNFSAKRVTTSFEDKPWYETPRDGAPGAVSNYRGAEYRPLDYAPLHPVGRYSADVIYRKGSEVLQSDQSGPRGLTTTGEFGPILGTVLVDAVHGNLSWSHWEPGDNGPLAVFRFSVPKDKSHYDIGYCCVIRGYGNLVSFHEASGYDGEIAVDPSTGTIFRLSLKATGLKRPDPIFEADILVEYGPVALGNRTYICPLKGVAVSVILKGGPGPATDNDPLQRLLNDVAFEQYHVFRSDARLLTPAASTP